MDKRQKIIDELFKCPNDDSAIAINFILILSIGTIHSRTSVYLLIPKIHRSRIRCLICIWSTVRSIDLINYPSKNGSQI